jgi:hypothetical protein
MCRHSCNSIRANRPKAVLPHKVFGYGPVASMAKILNRPGDNIEARRGAHDHAHFGSGFPSPGTGSAGNFRERHFRMETRFEQFSGWTGSSGLFSAVAGPVGRRDRDVSTTRWTISRVTENSVVRLCVSSWKMGQGINAQLYMLRDVMRLPTEPGRNFCGPQPF